MEIEETSESEVRIKLLRDPESTVVSCSKDLFDFLNGLKLESSVSTQYPLDLNQEELKSLKKFFYQLRPKQAEMGEELLLYKLGKRLSIGEIKQSLGPQIVSQLFADQDKNYDDESPFTENDISLFCGLSQVYYPSGRTIPSLKKMVNCLKSLD